MFHFSYSPFHKMIHPIFPNLKNYRNYNCIKVKTRKCSLRNIEKEFLVGLR